MSKRRLHLLILVLTLAGLSCAPLYATAPQTTPDDVAIQIIELMNTERQALNLEPFVINDQLNWMAQVRSDDMVASDYAGHHPPDGHPTLSTLTEELGYNRALRPVENIALIPISDGNLCSVAKQAVQAWRDSPGHWQWVTSPHYWITGVGISVADDHVIITQLFWGSSGFTPQEVLAASRTQGP
jgi:uncharacterized protein YkwD